MSTFGRIFFLTRFLLPAAAMMLFVPAVAIAKVPTFEEAFSRELRELTATRDALAESLAENTQRFASKKQTLSQQIETTMHELEKLQQQHKQLTMQRDAAIASAEQHMDNNAMFDAMLRTATESNAGCSKHASKTSDHETFLYCMQNAIADLKTHSEVIVQKSTFFSMDATETNGTVMHIGNIAALGLDDISGVVLSRTPQGDLTAIETIPPPMARALMMGKRENPVLISPFSKEVYSPDETRDLWQTAQAGGPVAFIILGVALLGILLVLERVWTLLGHSNFVPSGFQKINALIGADRIADAQKLSRKMGSVGRAVRYVLENKSLPRDEIENGVNELALRTLPKMDRSLAVLTVITTATPLLGLLGTVTGMISTFDVITHHGTGNPALLSGGISEALITTKFGLAVAVPFLLVRSLIAKWAKNIMDNMHCYCLAAINLVKRGDRV